MLDATIKLQSADFDELLVDPSNPAVAETTTNQMLVAARTLGLELHVLNASTVLRTRARAWCD
jgi:hypothetical protein